MSLIIKVTENGQIKEYKDFKDGFFTAFRGGQVLGFTLVGLSLLLLDLIIIGYKVAWFDNTI